MNPSVLPNPLLAACVCLSILAPVASAEEPVEQGTKPAPASTLPEKKEDPAPAGSAQAGKGLADEQPHETLYVLLLVNGTRVKAVKYLDFGDTYSFKDEQGQFRNLKKDEVLKILDPLHPPAKAEPVKPKAGVDSPAAKPPAASEPPKPEARKPEPAARPAAPPAASPPAKNGPQTVFVLKDGRREKAFQYYLQGEYYVLQSTGGYLVKVKKADVVKIEE